MIIKKKISAEELKALAKAGFGDMVKGVVDISLGIIALGGELHADAESLLLEQGSKQKDLWGFNIYINKDKKDRIEYNSLINIRPSDNNASIEIKNQELRSKIKNIIDALVE